jgi:hypothetical protein
VSCYVKRRQPPDVFPDDLNCTLNFCDCSMAVVGGEWLPSSSINSVPASPSSSHILLPLVAYSFFLLLLLHHGKSKKGGSSSHHSGDKRKREPTPPSEDFGDSEYLEEEFSSGSYGSPTPASSPASSDDSDNSQGIAVEVWTYIRAVERAGLEGSDESEESGGGDDGEGDDDGRGGGDGDSGEGGDEGDSGSSRGGSGKGSGGSGRGSNKASG